MVQFYQEAIPMKIQTVPVPKAVLVPTTEQSIPFNAASHQMSPMNLSDYGYLEEEYFVSGEARVYQFGETADEPIRVRVSGAPYTYRILVRKPADSARFSGTALVEVFNYANLMDNPGAGWGAMNEYLMSRGDVWVGISIRDSVMKALKRYDPQRYAPLSMENPVPKEYRKGWAGAYGIPIDPECENGLCYDVISQVGMLLRSGAPYSPLAGYQVSRVYATGASAGDMSTYAGYVHNYAVQENEKPVYDGFTIFMTGAPANLNQEERNILAPDPRAVIFPCVPTIRVLTLGDMLGKGYHPDWSAMQRRPDSDEPGKEYRIYEVAGASIGYRADKPVYPCREDVERVGARWKDPFPELPEYAFPAQYQIRAAFDALKKWVELGISAPHAARLETTGDYPDTDFVLDANGNACGGVRSPYVDVPIAAYSWDGTIAPFSDEKLRALYPTKADYLAKVAASCVSLCAERLLLAEDAVEILASAKKFSDRWDWA